MRKYFSIRNGLVVLLLGLLSIAVSSAIISFKSYSLIDTDIQDEKRPEQLVIVSEILLNDLSDAEIDVKSFSLTLDTLYLNQFFRAADSATLHLEKFHDLNDGKGRMILMDTLDVLIKRKFSILNQLLLMKDRSEVKLAFENLLLKLDAELDKVVREQKQKGKRAVDKKELKETKSIWNQIQQLFQRKKVEKLPRKKDRTKESAVYAALLSRSTKEYLEGSTLKNQVAKGAQSSEKQVSSLRQEELDLIKGDKMINERIRALVSQIEKAEMQSYSSQLRAAKTASIKLNQRYTFNFVFIALMLILLFLLFIYFEKEMNRRMSVLLKAGRIAEIKASSRERFLFSSTKEIYAALLDIENFLNEVKDVRLTKQQTLVRLKTKKAIANLWSLVDDALIYTKLQLGVVDTKIEPFDVREEIEKGARQLRESEGMDQLAIQCQLDEKLPSIVLGDTSLFNQLMKNLLLNAIRNLENGKVEVIVSMLHETEMDIRLRIEVTDNGLGLSSEQLHKLQTAFEMETSGVFRSDLEGGLGLSVVNLIVVLLSGKLEIFSVPEKGTTVFVELPFRKEGEKEGGNH